MSIRDSYRILGIAPGAEWEEVRRRFRTLAYKHHPDRNPDDPGAVAHFRRVVEAYEAIQGARLRPRAAAQNYRPPRFTGKEHLFEDFFGIPRCGYPLQQSPGANFRYDLEISFAAAILGMETVIQVDHTLTCLPCRGTGLAPGGSYRRCPDCQGRGRRFGGPGLLCFGPRCDRCQGRGKIVAQACQHCGGNGGYQETREYHVKIPPGTQEGARLRINGEGGEGFYNGPAGNLEVVIHVAPHEFLTRVGNDLYCKVQVSFAQAALGGTIWIPTLKGYETFSLPRGTQSGKIFRFPGAGAPGGPHRPRGDQVMEVVVTTPENLNYRQRQILEELAHLDREPAVGFSL